MIKANVTIVGKIAGEPRSRQTKDGKNVLSFPIYVVIPAKQGINKTILVTVNLPEDLVDPLEVYNGKRTEVTGEMNIVKRNDNLQFYLDATGINTFNAAPEDSIKGELIFRGTVGKMVDQRTSKKGDPFVVFSAYSGEKVGNDFVYVWSRFLFFNHTKEAWLEPKVKVSVKGDLNLSVYNDNLDISCKVSEMEQYIPNTNYQNNNRQPVPQQEQDPSEVQPF